LAELSGGQLSLDVPVLLNRAIVEHDVALVVGPVLPHEVVGMSGGNKYFFPGVGGQQIIDVSHWLGALITSAEIIGTTGITPVRALIDEASALIPAEKGGIVRSAGDCVVAGGAPT
jgi:nickel-dependent lactate racemase